MTLEECFELQLVTELKSRESREEEFLPGLLKQLHGRAWPARLFYLSILDGERNHMLNSCIPRNPLQIGLSRILVLPC